MENGFTWGFVYGFTSAGILGYIAGRIRRARGSITKSNKHLDTFPDAYQPNITPWKVVKESIFSAIAWIFWIIIFIAAFIFIFWVYPYLKMSLGSCRVL